MAAGQKPELWGDVSTGRFAEARKFANQGKWDQAAQQYKLGGGQGFTQPQYEAFTKQYGNIGSLPGQLGEVVGQPGVPDPGFQFVPSAYLISPSLGFAGST